MVAISKVTLSQRGKLLDIIRKTRRVVVKIGSSVLADKEGGLSHRALLGIAREIAVIQQRGVHLILVSSGAIASGMHYLGFEKKPRRIEQLQACAAIGQPILVQFYQKALARTKLQVAQVLLTRSDLEDRKRFLNARRTLTELLQRGVIPIINENDTVVVEEIRVGDNDNLAALVTHLVDADLLILLTDQDGFHTADPRQHRSAAPIRFVENLNREAFARASDTRKAISVGGMRTKLEAAQKVARFGIPTLIANGRDPKILKRLFAAEEVGTLLLPPQRKKT